jgi:hypothetical protein
MVKICQTGLLKSNFETRPKKRIFRFLPKISAGHGWNWKFFFANFQILGPLGCQGWVVIPQNVKKSQNHCTLLHITASGLFFIFTQPRYYMYFPRYCIIPVKFGTHLVLSETCRETRSLPGQPINGWEEVNFFEIITKRYQKTQNFTLISNLFQKF